MLLNSNRKNVAKIAAVSCSVCLLPRSYQLNDVGDVSLVMENVRDGLKSNIISCPKIKEKFLQGLTNAKKFVSRPFVSAYNRLGKNKSIQKFKNTLQQRLCYSENMKDKARSIPIPKQNILGSNNSTESLVGTSKLSLLKKFTDQVRNLSTAPLCLLGRQIQAFCKRPSVTPLTAPITKAFRTFWTWTSDEYLTELVIRLLRFQRRHLTEMIVSTLTPESMKLIFEQELLFHNMLLYGVLGFHLKRTTTEEEYKRKITFLSNQSSELINIAKMDSCHWENLIMTLLNDPEQLSAINNKVLENVIQLTAKYGEPGLLEVLLTAVNKHPEIPCGEVLVQMLKEVQSSYTDNLEDAYRLIENERILQEKVTENARISEKYNLNTNILKGNEIFEKKNGSPE